MNIKQQLYNHCVSFVEKRLETIETTISSHQKSLHSETKSSAGDKHETGRAMLQLEMEKAGQQLVSVQQSKELLEKVKLEPSTVIRLGSLITTNTGIYFLAISVGMVTLERVTFFVVSTASPIGKLLLGKQVGDKLRFNGRDIEILSIE